MSGPKRAGMPDEFRCGLCKRVIANANLVEWSKDSDGEWVPFCGLLHREEWRRYSDEYRG